ncbi:MAG: hypothetical protein JXP34_06165 [Planctomycetes bacterium]|nr:hypothetical protein [Planctomycetota bacterium]
MRGEVGLKLFVAIVKDHRQVEDIVMGFLELGIRGGTVLEGRGMGEMVSMEVPIFAGLRSLFPGGTRDSYIVLSAMDDSLVDGAFRLVDEVCGGLENAGTGIAWTIPIDRIRGTAQGF